MEANQICGLRRERTSINFRPKNRLSPTKATRYHVPAITSSEIRGCRAMRVDSEAVTLRLSLKVREAILCRPMTTDFAAATASSGTCCQLVSDYDLYYGSKKVGGIKMAGLPRGPTYR